MTTETKSLKAACTECDAEIIVTEIPFVHEILPCAECGMELEVIALEPLQLSPAPEVEEDWGE